MEANWISLPPSASSKAAAPFLWWRPRAATLVVAMNKGDVVAADTIFVLRLSKSGRTVGQTGSRLDGWSVGRTMIHFGLCCVDNDPFWVVLCRE